MCAIILYKCNNRNNKEKTAGKSFFVGHTANQMRTKPECRLAIAKENRRFRTACWGPCQETPHDSFPLACDNYYRGMVVFPVRKFNHRLIYKRQHDVQLCFRLRSHCHSHAYIKPIKSDVKYAEGGQWLLQGGVAGSLAVWAECRTKTRHTTSLRNSMLAWC